MPADVKMIGNGRDIWYRKRVTHLMGALIEFEPHPLDRQHSNQRFDEAVQQTA